MALATLSQGFREEQSGVGISIARKRRTTDKVTRGIPIGFGHSQIAERATAATLATQPANGFREWTRREGGNQALGCSRL